MLCVALCACNTPILIRSSATVELGGKQKFAIFIRAKSRQFCINMYTNDSTYYGIPTNSVPVMLCWDFHCIRSCTHGLFTLWNCGTKHNNPEICCALVIVKYTREFARLDISCFGNENKYTFRASVLMFQLVFASNWCHFFPCIPRRGELCSLFIHPSEHRKYLLHMLSDDHATFNGNISRTVSTQNKLYESAIYSGFIIFIYLY